MSLITIVRQLAGYTYVYRETDRQTGQSCYSIDNCEPIDEVHL